jgi:ABC-type multidrug transport system fused ATPase/permease subunit
MGLRSARVLYAQLSAAVIAAPMLFFETTPSGRILNRFTSDTQQVDFQLLMTLSQWINTVFQVLGALVLISAVNPIFLATLPVFIIIYTFAYLFSAPATRDLQRLESVSRSPLFSHFSETLQGLSTIRAYGATARFEATNAELLACNTRVQFNQDLAAQWVALRLDLISSLIVFLSILLPILTMQFGGSGASAAAFGLVIAYSLELSAFLKFMTRTTLDLQKGMAAVERIAEYIDELPPEPKGGAAAPEGVSCC